MNRTPKLVILIFMVAVTSVLGYDFRRQFEPLPLNPFFVYVAQTSLRFDPEVPIANGRGYAVRDDGSWVEIYQPNLSKETRLDAIRTIRDFPAMKKIVVDETTESITTYGMARHDIAMHKIVPKAHCGTPAGKLLGYDVEFIEGDPPLYVNKDGREQKMGNHEKFWEAPALGCYALRHEQYATLPDGAVAINSIWTAMYVTEGDVRKYFEIPPNYVERAPSEIDAELTRRHPDIPVDSNPNFDAVYRYGQWLLQHPEKAQ
jgi:hypothetical protein